MQSWKYQYDVDYQYTYGVAALILMSAIFVIAKLKSDPKRIVVLTSLCLCAVMTASLVYPKMVNVSGYLKNSASTCQQVDELIESVPTDATVTATHSRPMYGFRKVTPGSVIGIRADGTQRIC